MDGSELISMSRHPAETSVAPELGTITRQLVRLQQVLLGDKQDASGAGGAAGGSSIGVCAGRLTRLRGLSETRPGEAGLHQREGKGSVCVGVV